MRAHRLKHFADKDVVESARRELHLIVLIEILIICGILTAVVVPVTLKNPIAMLFDYPPKTQERVKSLKQYEGLIPTNEKKMDKKMLATLIALIAIICIMYFVNGVRTFQSALMESYVIWFAVTWYDALVLDCLGFVTAKKFAYLAPMI